jgi:hypothetical protein
MADAQQDRATVTRLCPGCGWVHNPRRLEWQLWLVRRQPNTAELLPDVTLAALWRWSDKTNPILAAEIQRRYGCGSLPR